MYVVQIRCLHTYRGSGNSHYSLVFIHLYLFIMVAVADYILFTDILKYSAGEPGYRSRYLSHAKRALYHLS